MEISHNTDAIRDFARRNDIDNKYLVDGANFVISKMHFNSENNYYITLGLQQNASPDEIRERWRKLMLLYHPDRQEGDDSWVSERAKKVNEAYSILKDDEKRRAFNRKLSEQAMSRKPESLSKTGQRAAHSRSSGKISQNTEWDRKKKNIPKILVAVYVFAALMFLGYLYLQDNSEYLENALIEKKGLIEQAQLEPGTVSEKNSENENRPPQVKTPDFIDRAEQQPHPPIRIEKEALEKKTMAHEVTPKPEKPGITPGPGIPRSVAGSQVMQQIRGDDSPVKENAAPTKTAPLLSPPATTTIMTPQERIQEPSQRSSSPPAGSTPSADYSMRNREQAAPVKQETLVSAHPAQSRKSADITQEEIEDFMKRYAAIYSKTNINSFMALFSRSVIENNRLHYNEMRDAYRETFSEKIDYYRINNMTIVLNGTTATVSGVYELNRYTSAEERWKRYSGRIQWKITKENNELKIISMNYDN